MKCPSQWDRKVPRSLPNATLKIGPEKELAFRVVLRLLYLQCKSTCIDLVLQMKTVGQCFVTLHFCPQARSLTPFKWKWKKMEIRFL